jgi:hypothetical protein
MFSTENTWLPPFTVTTPFGMDFLKQYLTLSPDQYLQRIGIRIKQRVAEEGSA